MAVRGSAVDDAKAVLRRRISLVELLARALENPEVASGRLKTADPALRWAGKSLTGG